MNCTDEALPSALVRSMSASGTPVTVSPPKRMKTVSSMPPRLGEHVVRRDGIVDLEHDGGDQLAAVGDQRVVGAQLIRDLRLAALLDVEHLLHLMPHACHSSRNGRWRRGRPRAAGCACAGTIACRRSARTLAYSAGGIRSSAGDFVVSWSIDASASGLDRLIARRRAPTVRSDAARAGGAACPDRSCSMPCAICMPASGHSEAR